MATPWTRFRNLCSYYIDCVKYSEKRQEYLFTNQLNETFMLPALEFNWHLKEQFNIETSREQRFARTVLLTADQSDELFIGYPLSSFISPKGTHCLCPLMLFPVSITILGEGRTSGLRITIDRQGIDLNRDWVEFHVPRDRQQYFIRACERTDDTMGCVDVENALQFISNHFGLRMDPNFMDFTLRHSDSKHELLNSAALFIGSKTKYTRTLIRELNQIRNEPDSVLDRTALAYVFRTPVLPAVGLPADQKRIPAVFTGQPLNAHQYRAVEEALNTPVCKVTGPPGTGKSHMSVNLIANEVFNGGSVLFTSKNHKAVHAVFEMCQECKPHPDFDLVEFCTVPGNDSSAQWDKMKDRLETVKGLAMKRLQQNEGLPDILPEEISYSAFEMVEEALDRFRDAEGDLRRYDELRKRVAQFERLIVEIDALLARIPEPLRDSEEFQSLLERCAEARRAMEPFSAWQRLLLWVRRLMSPKDDAPNVIAQLRSLAPRLATAYSRQSSVSKTAKRLLRTIRFRKVLEGWQNAEQEAVRKEEGDCNYDSMKQSLLEAQKVICKSLKDAYADSICMRVHDVDIEDLIGRIMASVKNMGNPLSFMTALEDGGEYDEALRLFGDFHKIFPAWAVTLLSLRKASPCLPGAFSLVLIDEASQCEIPPMIPALFRAQRVAVVGDPDQFPPVITMKPKRDQALRKKHGVTSGEMNKYAFCENNVFSVIPRDDMQTVRLTEHFRCVDEIAMYFNDEFYRGMLCPCVGDRSNQGYNAYGLKPGMSFVDAPGGDASEMSAAVEYLKTLRKVGFKGTVGVISPLRKLANEMKTVCHERKSELPVGLTDERINTANGFQGGQCDIVVFLLGLNDDRTPGRDLWYILADGNKYIYNVSVSRAKVCFVSVGDKKKALESGLSRISKLIPETRLRVEAKVGPGEPILKHALEKVGIETVAQYPIFGRYLDLAIVDRKVDIEVDGQAWHLDRNGCTKADDMHRDLILETNGWTVVRVWHHEVISDIDGCIRKVRAAIGV